MRKRRGNCIGIGIIHLRRPTESANCLMDLTRATVPAASSEQPAVVPNLKNVVGILGEDARVALMGQGASDS